MNMLELIDGIIELLSSWRYYLYVLVGLGLGALILSLIANQLLAWILAGGVGLCCFVVGWRWDS